MSYYPAWEHHPFSVRALADFSVGVAVFGQDGRCHALNYAFARITRELDDSHLGKTLAEVCGVEDSTLQAAFVRVSETGESVRDLWVEARPSNGEGSRTWIIDFFPLHNTGWGPDFIGVGVSDVTAASRLQQRYVEGLIPTPPDLVWSDRSSGPNLTRLSAKYRDVFRRSVSLMNRSMSIRRQMLQIRMGMRLSKYAIIRLPVQQQQREAQDSLRAKRNACCCPAAGESDVAASTIAKEKPSEFRKEQPSPRELQVLRLVAEGKSNKQIGTDLLLSTRTVETYRARLMSKLKVHSSAELICYAVRNQFVQL